MSDQDVRDMLRERASSITPAPDGMDRIEAKLAGEAPTAITARRRRPFPVLAAAAAVVAVALIGAVLVTRDDDTTSVESGPLAASGSTTSMLTSPFESALPRGIWPWPDDEVDDVVLSDPVETAMAYVQDRVPGSEITAEQRGDEVAIGGDVTTTVKLAEAGGKWHVVAAVSDLVPLHDADDGTVTASVETGGELIRTTAINGDREDQTTQVEGGEEFPGLGYTLGRVDAVQREVFVLDTVDGTIALTEVAFAPPTSEEPAVPSVEEPLGVWPWPVDGEEEIPPFTDPEDAAREYVTAWVGIGYSTMSEYREGDTTSGEVELSGDLESTVVVRQADDEWYVETSHTPLVDAVEGIDVGSVRLEANEAGTLTVEMRVPGRGVIASFPEQEMEPGDTATFIPPSDEVEPGDVVSVRYVLHTSRPAPNSEFSVSGIGEQLIDWGPASEDAIDTTDPSAVAEDFIEGLVDRDVTMGEVSDHEDADVQVPWDAGVVILDRDEDGGYSVVEAIGDSVQIVSVSPTDVGITGELRLAQAGDAHVGLNGSTATVRNDVDREGTIVPFTIERASGSGMLIVVFDTDTGYQSVAARILNR